MKTALNRLTALIVFGLGLSFATTLDQALTATENRTAVVNARLAFDDAQLALSRTQADPLALKLDKVQAQQRAYLTGAQYTQARYQAMVDISDAYTQLLEAQAQRDLALKARNISEQSLEIANIRFSKGSATALDVQEAENALEDANNNLKTAEQGAELARTNLGSLLGSSVESVDAIADGKLVALPALEDVLVQLSGHPNVIEAQNGAELAALSVDLLDPSYASQSQIDNAKLQAGQAQEFAKEARRGLELQARSLYNQASTASEALTIRRDALNNALEREALEKQRLDAGLIADINFKQTQLNTMQAQISALQAKHAYLSALLNLQAGTMTPVLEMTAPADAGGESE